MNAHETTRRRAIVLAKAFTPNLGGIETYSEQVAFAYARRGFFTQVITQFIGPLGTTTRSKDGSIIEVHNVGPFNQASVFAKMLGRLLSRTPYPHAFVHATTWRVAVPALIARLNPLIVTVHGREVMQSEGLLTHIMRSTLLRANNVGIISQYSLDTCVEKLPQLSDRSVVCWNGLSWPGTKRRATYESGGKLRILTACQLTRRKNVAIAIEAMGMLRDRAGEVFEIKIAGDGPEREALARLVKEKRLDKLVTFLGRVPREDMPTQYEWADVFLHPQMHSHDARDFESFCIAVADAMGFGLPTIAGRDGAPAEYIQHGTNGWLVTGRDPSEIAGLLEKLKSSVDLRTAVGLNARAFAQESFSWDRHVELLLSRVLREK